jgi:hypothetical protein
MKNSYFLYLFLALVLPLVAQADIKYVVYKDGKFSEVAPGDVETACGKNFAFRETKKDEVAAYLKVAVVKATFAGQMSPSIETLKDALKAAPGTCGWVTPEEFGKL